MNPTQIIPKNNRVLIRFEVPEDSRIITENQAAVPDTKVIVVAVAEDIKITLAPGDEVVIRPDANYLVQNNLPNHGLIDASAILAVIKP